MRAVPDGSSRRNEQPPALGAAHHPLYALVPDTPAIYQAWRQIVVAVGVSGVQVHDARLAAVMQVYGLKHILTFNTQDFARYPGITAVHPQDLVATP